MEALDTWTRRAMFFGDSFVAGVGDPAARRVRRLSPRLAGVCAGRDVPFVEVTAHQNADSMWVREARDGDGAHPSAGGYAELTRLLVRSGCLEWLR